MKNNRFRLKAAFLTVCIIALMAVPLTVRAATRTDVVINNNVNGLNVNISYDDFMLIHKLYPGESDSSVMTIRNTRAAPFTLSVQIVEVSGGTTAVMPNLADKANLKVTSGNDTLLETQNYWLWKDPVNNRNIVRIPSNYRLYGDLWADTRDATESGVLKDAADRLYPVYSYADSEIMGGLLSTNQTYALGVFDNIRNLALNFEASLIPETDNEYQGAEANFRVIFTVQTIPPIPINPPPEIPTPTSPELPEIPTDTPQGILGGSDITSASPTYETATSMPTSPPPEIEPTIETAPEEYIPVEEDIPEEEIPLGTPPPESIPTTIDSGEDEDEDEEEITEQDIPLSGLPVTGGIALTGVLIVGIAFIVLGKIVEGKSKNGRK